MSSRPPGPRPACRTRAVGSLLPALPLALPLALVLAGCAARQAPMAHTATPPVVYDVALHLDVQTPAPERPALAEALAPLERFGLDLDLVVEVQPSRRFRDGSLGWQVAFPRARATLLRPDPAGALAPAGPATTWGMEGRVVELRTFADGEVLTIDQVDRVSGPGALGDVLDALWPALSPMPPDFDAGETATARVRWPMVVAHLRGWRHGAMARWENQGQAEDGTWRLRWAGPLDSRGQDRGREPWIGVQGGGEISGELVLTDAPGMPLPVRVQSHDLTWSRELGIEYPGAVGGTVRIAQTQAGTVSVRRRAAPTEGQPVLTVPAAAAPEQDALSLPLYLGEAQVRAAVQGRAEALSTCTATLPEGPQPLAFAVAGDGAVVDARVGGEAAPACVIDALAAHGLPRHHGAPVPVTGTLFVEADRVRLGPVLEVVIPEVELIFLATPPDLGPDGDLALRQALGLAAAPPPEAPPEPPSEAPPAAPPDASQDAVPDATPAESPEPEVYTPPAAPAP